MPARPLLALALLSLAAHAATRAALASPRPPDHDSPHQLIVQTSRPAPGRTGEAMSRPALATRCAALGLSLVGALEDGMPGAAPASRALPGSARGPAHQVFGLDPSRVFLLEAPDAATAARALAALGHDPDIAWVEPNHARAAAIAAIDSTFPDDPMFRDTRQWGLANAGPEGVYGGVAGADIAARAAWEWTTGSNDLLLAVADTGIDPDHPDLAARMPDGSPRIVLGLNVTTDPTRSVLDRYGHGTPVTGVMAALTHNGALEDSLGVAGVCGGDGGANLGCRIVPIKITRDSSGNATAYDLARAILYATRVGARALNVSFGGLSPSRLERQALYEAVTHGCVVVAASGNWGFEHGPRPFYPAAYAAEGLCIQVGASDPFDRRIYFSSYGPGLDLLAPGVSIWTTYMTYRNYEFLRGYVAASGTSFAAPHVTGAVGLLAALRPELIDTDFQNVLRESAEDIGAPGIDPETGHGRLDAARALASVRRDFGIWHDEVAAQTFTHVRTDTLKIEEAGWGNLDRATLAPLADLIEVTATVSLPDSFIDSVRVWPRVGGTTTMRENFRVPWFTPWARVTEITSTTFKLTGYVFQMQGCPTCWVLEDADIPLPKDQARFGFTVMGRVDRTGAHGGPNPAYGTRRGAVALSVVPNPFRGSTSIHAPEGASVTITDVTGRIVRRFDPSRETRVAWDGRDQQGSLSRPGIYFVRCAAPGGHAERKVVRLE